MSLRRNSLADDGPSWVCFVGMRLLSPCLQLASIMWCWRTEKSLLGQASWRFGQLYHWQLFIDGIYRRSYLLKPISTWIVFWTESTIVYEVDVMLQFFEMSQKKVVSQLAHPGCCTPVSPRVPHSNDQYTHASPNKHFRLFCGGTKRLTRVFLERKQVALMCN